MRWAWNYEGVGWMYGVYKVRYGTIPSVSTYGIVQITWGRPGEGTIPQPREMVTWASQVASMIHRSSAGGWIIGDAPNTPGSWWGTRPISPAEYARQVEYILRHAPYPHCAIYLSAPDLSFTHPSVPDPLGYLQEVLDALPDVHGVAIDVRNLGGKLHLFEEALEVIASTRPYIPVLVLGITPNNSGDLSMYFHLGRYVESVVDKHRVSAGGLFFGYSAEIPLSAVDLESVAITHAILHPQGWLAWPLRGDLRIVQPFEENGRGIVLASNETTVYAAAPGYARCTDGDDGIQVIQRSTLPMGGELRSVEIIYSALRQSWVPMIREAYLGVGSPIGIMGPDGLHLEVRNQYGEREPIDPLPFLGSLLAPAA